MNQQSNIQAFMRQASLLTNNKLFFNKEYVKGLKIKDECMKEAKKILGRDIELLSDEYSIRTYLRDVFGKENLQLFYNAYSMIKLDIEHGLLLYYKLISEHSELIQQAMGLLYYIAGIQLDREFTALSKVSNKGKITPLFEMSKQLFRWKRCDHVLRKYMLNLTKPEGYTAYYVEKPNIAHIAYLMSQGKTLQEAESFLKTANGGIFYNFLPLAVENRLLNAILSGDFYNMNGLYAQAYLREVTKIESTLGEIDENTNVYNNSIKPNMIELMGMLTNSIVGEINKNTQLMPNDIKVYHISPYRVGILVKDGIDVESVLSDHSKYFKPVEKFNLRSLVFGEFF